MKHKYNIHNCLSLNELQEYSTATMLQSRKNRYLSRRDFLKKTAAARAGKDIFLQKPRTLTIPEERVLSDNVNRYGRVLQVGSQQRSGSRFRFACELARNGRIGKLHTVRVGVPLDEATDPQPIMPVPENLDYEMWLGPAPRAQYTEKRVHPQNDYSRPGWLRISDYCCGTRESAPMKSTC